MHMKAAEITVQPRRAVDQNADNKAELSTKL